MAILGSTTGGVTTESGWGTVSGCLTMPGSVGLGTGFTRGTSLAGGCWAAGGEGSGAGTMSAAKAGHPNAMRVRVNSQIYSIQSRYLAVTEFAYWVNPLLAGTQRKTDIISSAEEGLRDASA